MQETFVCNNCGVEFHIDDVIYVGDDLLQCRQLKATLPHNYIFTRI